MPRSPFELHDLRDAITNRAAKHFIEQHFERFIYEHSLGDSSLRRGDAKPIIEAFERGARDELERLSRSTGVNLRSVTSKVIGAGAKSWFRQVNSMSVNTCSLVMWKNLLTNSYGMGADFMNSYLFPHRVANQKKAVRRR
jgi:hypothetical protein